MLCFWVNGFGLEKWIGKLGCDLGCEWVIYFEIGDWVIFNCCGVLSLVMFVEVKVSGWF